MVEHHICEQLFVLSLCRIQLDAEHNLLAICFKVFFINIPCPSTSQLLFMCHSLLAWQYCYQFLMITMAAYLGHTLRMKTLFRG